MGMEKLTWRAAEFQFPRRVDWLIATNTPFGKARIDHTTLFKFYQRLEVDNTARGLFTELTDAFIKACGTSLKKQRTDSFYIHGWIRILSRYGLFKETIRKFLQALRKQKPGLYEEIKEQLSQNYLGKDFDLTEKDRELAQKKVALMAQDLYRLKCSFENHKQVQHYETFKILSHVFSQQCEVKDSIDAEAEIIIKEKPDKGAICTPHNTEVRYVRNGEYRKECAIRAGAEATVSELTRAHGMRKSRHRKQSRTRLRLIFAALACNVKLFIQNGEQYAYLEPEPA